MNDGGSSFFSDSDLGRRVYDVMCVSVSCYELKIVKTKNVFVCSRCVQNSNRCCCCLDLERVQNNIEILGRIE